MKKSSRKGGGKKEDKVFSIDFKDTSQIKFSKKLIDQVIGQDKAVEIIKKAAKQKRHVLLIGEPGTGKSMLGMALAELLPKQNLVDVLAYPNPKDDHSPIIRTVPACQGRALVEKLKLKEAASMKNSSLFLWIVALITFILPWWVRAQYNSDIMFAAFFLGGIGILFLVALTMSLGRRQMAKLQIPKLIIDNCGKTHAPFVDATGAHAGALLGDVLHDPFQSGGLGTPAHERVVPGMIHKAHQGVLFIDEIATLPIEMQQELLTAMQEGSYPITGQSEKSAGSMVRTQPVPCRFVLVAAGNLDTVTKMHPALRSRIRGYGYEVYMNTEMPDTIENRDAIARFVAQEVAKDGKIPHFTREAVELIVNEARKLANRKGFLTVRFRELGGLVRAAGDIAVEENSEVVLPKHVLKALEYSKSLEKQITEKYIERKKEYSVIVTRGKAIGRVNGLAVMGTADNHSGIVLPIEAEVIKNTKGEEIIATGKLGEIAKEAIKNVSALIKKYFGETLKSKYSIYVQFLQTYEGVEGDSASIAVATAIVSSLRRIPIKQDLAMTGSLTIRGEVLPVGGINAKIEAAIDAGIKTVIIPKSNLKDVVVDPEKLKKIKIVGVSDFVEVLELALDWKGHEKEFKRLKLAYKKDKKL